MRLKYQRLNLSTRTGWTVFSANDEVGSFAILRHTSYVCSTESTTTKILLTSFSTTLASVILYYVGLYCEDSWSPGWGHIYARPFSPPCDRHADLCSMQITIIVSISVSISMYCLIQLYVCVSSLLAPQKPLLKMFAIKAVGMST